MLLQNYMLHVNLVASKPFPEMIIREKLSPIIKNVILIKMLKKNSGYQVLYKIISKYVF